METLQAVVSTIVLSIVHIQNLTLLFHSAATGNQSLGNTCFSLSVENISALDSLSDSISVHCKRDRKLAEERGDTVGGFVP
mmetsp:Transcript_3777/g.5642  ORF Transcript_3777/g.5642 Transcript_3777/m.5642 type:complete len:81 (-) Transcript_3777:188-430(-)